MCKGARRPVVRASLLMDRCQSESNPHKISGQAAGSVSSNVSMDNSPARISFDTNADEKNILQPSSTYTFLFVANPPQHYPTFAGGPFSLTSK